MAELATLLLYLGIMLVIILICREIVCWYWKINRNIELLEKQNKILEEIKNFIIKEKPSIEGDKIE